MEPKVLLVLPMLIMLENMVESKKFQGRWTQWTQWSDCSLSCGSGITTRFREWQPPPGTPVSENGPFTENQNIMCNDGLCPVDGKWNAWGRWSPCSKACGLGETLRNRSCNPPSNGGKKCEGENYEKDECNRVPCPPLPRHFNKLACKSEKMFMCESKLMCIPIEEYCDNTVGCHDGSDESKCFDVNDGGSGKYSYVREAGAEHRSSLFVVTSLVTLAMLSRSIG